MKRILPCSFFQAHARSLGLDSSHNLFLKKSFYYWRSFLIRNVYLLLSTLVFFVLEVWQCLTTWFGRQLKSLSPGGIVVAERDGHAIARISPGATFGECLGHEIILNYELLWAGLTLYCGFWMKCLSFHVDRLAMLGVSPVCNSDWQSCYNETIASLIGVGWKGKMVVNLQERAVTIRAVLLACWDVHFSFTRRRTQDLYGLQIVEHTQLVWPFQCSFVGNGKSFGACMERSLGVDKLLVFFFSVVTHGAR